MANAQKNLEISIVVRREMVDHAGASYFDERAIPVSTDLLLNEEGLATMLLTVELGKELDALRSGRESNPTRAYDIITIFNWAGEALDNEPF